MGFTATPLISSKIARGRGLAELRGSSQNYASEPKNRLSECLLLPAESRRNSLFAEIHWVAAPHARPGPMVAPAAARSRAAAVICRSGRLRNLVLFSAIHADRGRRDYRPCGTLRGLVDKRSRRDGNSVHRDASRRDVPGEGFASPGNPASFEWRSVLSRRVLGDPRLQRSRSLGGGNKRCYGKSNGCHRSSRFCSGEVTPAPGYRCGSE